VAVNEVQLTISVGDNGSLGVVAKKADAAAKSTGRLSRSTKDLGRVSDTTYRTMQGTAGTSSNLTKNFAKQAQGIQGGLVPAYATLAANVFAITAAFGALQRAAQVEQLVEGFTFLGNIAGRTAVLVSQSLIEITDNALSMEQALRAASAGFSAGFDTSSMQRLAQVAKNAAQALGRDVGDATDRLIRGVAKLEPEILDELGIFVRLEPAVQKYASSLGKSASTLTEAERRQAFLNEALDQGERKFGNLTGQVGTNPYDQLAAAFNNLAKSFFNLVNNGLTPIISFFANNVTAFTGAIILFGSTVVQQMIPALGQMADVAAQKAEKVVGAAERMRDKAAGATRELEKSLNNMSAPVGKNNIYKQILPSIVDGTASSKKLERATKAIKNAITGKTNVMKKAGADEKKIYQDQIRDLERVEKKLHDIADARKGGGTAALKADLAESKGISALLASDEAAAVQNADGVLESFALASTGFSDYRERMKDTFKQERDLVGGRGKAFKKFGLTVFQGFTKAAVGARLFGIAIVGAIPFIGKILLIGGILLGFLKKLFTRTDEVTKAQEKLNKVLDTVAEKDEQFKKEVKRLQDISTASKKAAIEGEIYANTLKIQAGFTDEFTTQVIELNNAILEDNSDMGLFGALFHLATSGTMEFLTEKFNSLTEGVRSMGTAIKEYFAAGLAELMEVGEIQAVVKKVQDFIEKQRQAKMFTEALMRATEAYNTALENGGELAVLVGNKFGKAGIAGRMQELKDSGLTAAEAIGQINDELEAFSKDINRRNANVQSLGDSFVELTQRLTKFREKLAAKDEFLELAKEIDSRINLIATIAKDEGAGNAASVLASQFADGKTDLTQFGISLKDLQEEGTPALVKLSDKFRDISELQNTIKDRQKQMKLDIEFTKAGEAAAKAEVAFNNIAETLREFGVANLPGLDYFDALSTAYSTATTSIMMEFRNKRAIADLEYELMDRKLELEQILNKDDKDRVASLEQQRRVVEDTRKKVIETLNAQEGAATTQAGTTFVGQQVSQRDALVGSIKNAETFADKIEIIQQGLRDVGSVSEDGALNDLLSVYDPEDTSTKIVDGAKAQLEIVKDLVRTGIEQFKQLGPEGEVVAAMMEGMLLITDSFVKLGETIENVFARVAKRTGEELGADGLAGKLKFSEMAEIGLAATATVAASVSALMNTLAAATRNRIAGVDKEIEAEKKRDGKSKESVARIAQLEKKKEALKRKEFEQKKKAMMAEVVMSTAMAIASALPLLSNPLTAILGKVLIGMIATMGAAQLAIISGMSYQGGGSGSAGGGGVSSVSVGDRRSTVDMARSQGARGEIGYMRGEQGTGGPENFTPAFGGYRNRAEGGNAAFMVGEQGPELFVPNRAGTIVPNDDIVGGGTTNVSFNINTIDASGVEDMLTVQRGNIIGMIRDAANSYGEDFVESVDTSILTPTAGAGASRY